MLRVAELCKEKGITQQTLAKKLGIQYQSLYAALNGNPKLDTLKKIADVLEVKLTDLFEKKESDIIGFLRVHGYLKQVSSLEDLEQLVDDIKTGKI
ncbi:XRE family transcriptional regulator [Butyricimonas virosa]|uniref:XRE family transcriptional regulator n=1 Tax=Butyricimonas virosa TaxID=544645 RepID=A0A413IU08_9BACT|nr:helix-turn-helix transcriptional regulator [Butyricimonas virosa]RGY21360.1 XRE family transcriptional regulator [Butyricimonas virosa]